MAGLRFTELRSPMEFLDFTSVTLDEFKQLVPPFEARSKPGWRRGGWMGNPDPSSVYRVQKLPPADARRSALVYSHLPEDLRSPSGRAPVRHGPGQSQSVDSSPLARAAGRARALGDTPARSLTALARRLGVSEADAATVVTPLAEEPVPVVPRRRRTGIPPFAHDGTKRRMSAQDPLNRRML